MNDGTPEAKKTAVIKTLAIIGFVVTLVFGAWLIVQAIRSVPVVFNTLQYIATTIRNNQAQEAAFVVATGTDIINTGETLTLSWTRAAQEGTYSFSYQCTDGVVAEIPDGNGGLSVVTCGEEKAVADNSSAVAVIFSSEKSRFVDVPYTITFTPADDADPVHDQGTITVVNPSLSVLGITATSTVPVEETVQPTTTPVTPPPTPAPQPKPKPTTITAIPVSNPTGYTDLSVTFVGIYDARTAQLIPVSSLSDGQQSAVRFEVKNIGTKTSGEWRFSVITPSDSPTYTSGVNAPLKPNERQVVTVRFQAQRDSGTRITVVATGGGDTTPLNNSFSRQLTVSR